MEIDAIREEAKNMTDHELLVEMYLLLSIYFHYKLKLNKLENDRITTEINSIKQSMKC
jgi:hypothetical protein